jgi:hypothetical protein
MFRPFLAYFAFLAAQPSERGASRGWGGTSMSLPEALQAVAAAGVVLALDDHGPVLRPAGRAPREAVSVLKAHRDRVTAILRLREIHRAMGFGEEDVFFIEKALLSGAVREVRIAAHPPMEVQA